MGKQAEIIIHHTSYQFIVRYREHLGVNKKGKYSSVRDHVESVCHPSKFIMFLVVVLILPFILKPWFPTDVSRLIVNFKN